MESVMKVTSSCALVAFVVLAAAAPAQAITTEAIAGSGYAGIAGNGNSGFDAFGNKWLWSKTLGGYTAGVPKGWAAWGTPGLGKGYATYEGSAPAIDFEISFVLGATGAAIDTAASSGPLGYNEATRFSVCSATCVAWTPVFTGGREVDFFAPAGTALVDGEHYFVNVVFNNGKPTGKNAGFTAYFSGLDVPEPAAWALMLVGFGGVGAALRRRTATLGGTAA
jgi:hypothetical protein